MKTTEIKKYEMKKDQLEIAREIIDIISEYCNADVTLPTRKHNILWCKKIAQFIIKDYCDKLAYSDIGGFFKSYKGKTLDHASVMYNVRHIKELLSFDKEIQSDYNALDNYISNVVDISLTSKGSINKKKAKLNVICKNMEMLDDADFYELVEIINNNIKNYQWKQ